MKDRVAIVTGAARGIGATIAGRLAEAGATVVIGDVLDDRGLAVADSIGKQAAYKHLDVSSGESWQAFVDDAVHTFGPPSVLVNNAAVVIRGSLTEMSEHDFRKVIEVDLVGSWLGIKHVAPVMGERGGGSIVNIGSIAGVGGHIGTGAYAPAKAGVLGLTKTAAMELGPSRIRVNTVLPGWTDTEIQGDNQGSRRDPAMWADQAVPRIGQPDDVADMVLFLASDASSYCTGTEFRVDGGASLGYRQPHK